MVIKRYTNYLTSLLWLMIGFLSVIGFTDLKAQNAKAPELLYFKFDNPGASGTIENKALPSTRPVDQAQIVGNPSIGGSGQFGSGLQGPTDDNNKILANWQGTVTGSFTISWWLDNYPPGNNTSHWGTPNGNGNFHLWFNNLGWLYFRYQGNYNSFFQPNNWNFPVVIHCVYDDPANEVRFYRNGVLETTATWNNGGNIDIDDWQVGHGSTNGGGIPNGATLDEFRFYDRALSTQEVQNTWNKELYPLRGDTNMIARELVTPVTPDTSDCGLQSNEQLTLQIGNSGESDLPAGESFDIYYQVDGGTVHSDNFTLSSSLGSGNGRNFQLSQTFDMLAKDTYDIKAWVDYAKDTIPSGDTLTKQIVNPNKIALTPLNYPSLYNNGSLKSFYKLEDLTITYRNSTRSDIPAGTTIPIKYKTSVEGLQTYNWTLQNDWSCGDTLNVNVDEINMACPGNVKVKTWADWNNYNDTFSQTFGNPKDSLTACITTDGGQGDFTISGIPSSYSGGLKLKFYATGDLTTGTTSEYAELLGENGNAIQGSLIGQSSSPSYAQPGQNGFGNSCANQDCAANFPVGYRDITIPASTVSDWASDGQIQLTGNFGSGVNWDYCSAMYLKFELTQKPNVPTNPLTGINMPDTVYVNSPVNIFSRYKGFYAGYQWLINGEDKNQNVTEIQHSFANTGKDTVKLITAGCFGLDTSQKIVEVVQPTRAPNTNFIANNNVIDPLETVDFTNLTEYGPTSFTWEISPQTNNGNPSFVWESTNSFTQLFKYEGSANFLTAGVYEVSLTTQNVVGQDQETKPAYIRVRDYHDICSEPMDTDSIGTLRDGDGTYPANANCTYLIQPCAEEIELNLDKLELEKNEAFLRIYDGTSAQGEPLWDENAYGPRGITGDTSHPGFEQRLKATSGAVFVQFISGGSPEGEGFRLGWNGNSQSLTPLTTSIQGDTTACFGQAATFNAQSSGSGSNYQWYFNSNTMGPPDGTGETFAPVINDQQPDTVRLVTAHCGRFDTVSKALNPVVTNTNPQVEFSANKTLANVGDTINLQENTEGCIQGRKWIIQPTTFDYVKGTSSDDMMPEVQFNQAGVYAVKLVDTTNGGNVGTKVKSGYITILDYCTPSVVNMNNDIGMSRFKLEEIDHSSDVGNQAYQNFIDQTNTATLEKGGTFPLTIERFTSVNPVHYKVWIDFNKDGDFEESQELVYQNRGYSGQNLKDQLTIPQTVSFGNYRLRVGANLGQVANTSCGPNKYGEYEDYNVQIVPDKNAPDILTQGGDTVQIAACHSPHQYIQGAFARDEVDGTINNLNVMGSVDSSSPGIYNVDYMVTDNNGNDTMYTQTFEVMSDQMAPTFDLAGPDTLVLGVNQPYHDPGYSGLMDNCAGVSSITIDSSNLNNQELGTYPVDYTAADNNGNQRQKTRMVHVADTVAPNATLAGSAVMDHNVNQNFNDPGLKTLSDNYWDSSEISVNVMGTVNYQQPGQYQLEYHMEDGSGNKAMLKRMVNVQDLTAPTVDGPANDTIVLDVNNSLGIMDHINISDNFSEATIMDTSGSFYLNFPMGQADQLGKYSLDLVVADQSGNQTPVNLTVKVVDRVAPDISLKGPAFVVVPRFENTPYESTDSVSVSDNYYENYQVTVDTQGSYFDQYKVSRTIGAYDIVYTAEDPSGNVSEKVVRNVQIGEASGIEGEQSSRLMDVYPNPTQGEINVKIKGDQEVNGRLSLVNSVGQTVEEITQGKIKDSYFLDLSDHEAGVYFLKLNTQDGVKLQQVVLTQ